MPQYVEVHPDNPQQRLLKQAAQVLHAGGIAAVPTDSSYALVCHLDDKSAAEKLRRIRGVDDKHHLTLLCRDLSELASYARVDNKQYRLLKSVTPGPFTFILEATKEVPRRVSHPSRRTIGLRVPDHTMLQQLLEVFGEPLLATTLIMPGETEPLNDPEEIRERLRNQIEAVVDAGACKMEPTTVVDLTGDEPAVLRLGRGDPARVTPMLRRPATVHPSDAVAGGMIRVIDVAGLETGVSETPANPAAADGAVVGQHALAGGLDARDGAVVGLRGLHELLGAAPPGPADVQVVADEVEERVGPDEEGQRGRDQPAPSCRALSPSPGREMTDGFAPSYRLRGDVDGAGHGEGEGAGNGDRGLRS